MSLLADVVGGAIDPAYVEAARRREATGVRRRSSVVLTVVAGVLGLTVAAGVVALRAPSPSAVQARSLLEDRITEQSARLEQLRTDNAAVSAQITALQEQALDAGSAQLLGLLRTDSAVTGATPVTGPGVRVTVSDAPADPAGHLPDDARVQDFDLQVVVNGLWEAGAEAVAVNGNRLTATTAIRSAGSAILVDVVAVTGPYVVEAIGDPATLETGLARSAAGEHLALLRSAYAIGSAVARVDRLELPGVGLTPLRHAEAAAGSVTVPQRRTPTAADGVAGSGTQ